MVGIIKRIMIEFLRHVVYPNLRLTSNLSAPKLYTSARYRQMGKRILLVVLALGFMSAPPLAIEHESTPSGEAIPVRLILQTSKVRYRASESIEITALLVNTSEYDSYYVGTDFGSFFVSSPLHYLELVITDLKGKEVPVNRSARDLLITPIGVGAKSPTVPEIVERDYVKLQPGAVYGLRELIEVPLRPGRYLLTATYHEVAALPWTDAERKALPVPVWTQTLVSNKAAITIVP